MVLSGRSYGRRFGEGHPRVPVARLWASVGLVCWCCIGLCPTAALTVQAADVSVFSRTSLRLEIATQGRRLFVRGELRDNLFQGLADRSVTVTISPAADQVGLAGPIERQLRTDRNGQFRFRDLLDEGVWVIGTHFAGDDWHTPSLAERRLEIRRRELQIELDAPAASPIWADIPIDVVVTSPGPMVRWPVDLMIDGVTLIEPVLTDEHGRANLQVSTVTQEGTVGIEALFRGDDVYLPTSVSTRVQVYQSAWIHLNTAEVVQGRDYRLLAMRGMLESDVGPIQGAEITIQIDGSPLTWSVASDEAGAFELLESIATLDQPGSYRIEAVYDPHGTDEADLRVQAFAEIAFGVGPLATAVLWAKYAAGGFTIAMLVAFIAFQLSTRVRSRRSAPRMAVPPGHGAPAHLVELSVPPRRSPRRRMDVGGRVLDAESNQAVGPGEIRLDQLDAGRSTKHPVGIEGEFGAGTLDPGRYQAATQVPGYVATRFAVKVPHRGEYSQMEVYVSSVRSWVRYLYQRMTEQLELYSDEEGVWGKLTPRQIEQLIGETYLKTRPSTQEAQDFQEFRRSLEALSHQAIEPASDRLLRGLTLLVEEVYYSGRAYEEDLIELCRTLTGSFMAAVVAGAQKEGDAT